MDDEHHDERYEDGEVFHDNEDWLSKDGESQWLPIGPLQPVQKMAPSEARNLLLPLLLAADDLAATLRRQAREIAWPPR